ncbi:MAG: DUF4331 domain-containing protein, partial [Acidobacteriota bacterium]|nr:DUF4331 domain-containing protein [Acidobacteriota bacterium]
MNGLGIFRMTAAACSFVAILVLVGFIEMATASDHADTPLLKEVGRHDARLTDLYAFERGGSLVLVLCTNPTIAEGTSDYLFPPDVKFRVLIDNDSAVTFDDAEDLESLGGTVVDPSGIEPEIELQVRFNRAGAPQLGLSGLSKPDKDQVSLFAGLRDDPFIRIPREGRNVAAIVIELPMSLVVGEQPTLLIWATSKVDRLAGGQHELAGRALHSQLGGNDLMNTLPPHRHAEELGVSPDVMIYDTSRPATFPNGREL